MYIKERQVQNETHMELHRWWGEGTGQAATNLLVQIANQQDRVAARGDSGHPHAARRGRSRSRRGVWNGQRTQSSWNSCNRKP